ncbi:hypothetical protein AMELA_G00145940 [Ameiurus melas]|uniref:Uncharacterized protein n=1 Tax=Ameiurus melas TaxID=219545 RepID=A0A7J6AG78_AMEME|nr:hypothetical protein AMELA_G00145940 [Ameiurus melas]
MNSIVAVVQGFPETLVKNYSAVGCRMSLKVYILDACLDQFKVNMGVYSEEQDNKPRPSCPALVRVFLRHAHTTSQTSSPNKSSIASIHQDLLFTEVFTYFNSLHKGSMSLV